MEQDWQNWSVCLDGRSADPAAFKGLEAQLPSYLIPFVLSLSLRLPLYTQMTVFPCTLKRTQQKTASWGLALPNHSVHTQMHTADVFVRSSILFYFLSLSFFYVAISIFSLFSGIFWSCFWVRGSVGEMVGCPLWGRLKWCPKEIGLMRCRWRTSKTHAKSMLIWYFFWGAHHTEQRSNWVTIYPYILVSHK